MDLKHSPWKSSYRSHRSGEKQQTIRVDDPFHAALDTHYPGLAEDDEVDVVEFTLRKA